MTIKRILVNVHNPKTDDRRTKLTMELIRAYHARRGETLYFYRDKGLLVAATHLPQGTAELFSVNVDGENRTRLNEDKLLQLGAEFGDILEFDFIDESKAIVKVHRERPEIKEYHIPLLPEEVENSLTYIEGATKQITINAYERDPRAREACIEHYGLRCRVCELNFEEFYGEIGKDYIHVHHLNPISSISKEYKLNPIKELRPVCPNCHAMLHRKSPPYTIEEMRRILRKRRE